MPKVKIPNEDFADYLAITLRAPLQLHEKIEKMKRSEHRSMNSQCIWLLERALQSDAPRIPVRWSEDMTPVSLRLPPKLYKLIDHLHTTEHRSMNNQILWLLEKAVQLQESKTIVSRPTSA